MFFRPMKAARIAVGLVALLTTSCATDKEAVSQKRPASEATSEETTAETLGAPSPATVAGSNGGGASNAAVGDVAGPTPSANLPWSVTVASWNVLNFGNRKAGLPPANMPRPNLLTRMAAIISNYDVVVLQEILNGGASVTVALAPYLPNYTCANISAPAGRAGRQENYSVCYNNDPNLAYVGAFDYLGHPYTALDGMPQTAQQIWMRPPAYVTFRYRKPDNSYFQFDVTTIHTKPQYSTGPRPPGTPVHAPKNASVRNELTSTQTNLQSTSAKRIVIGDLNADCVYYQPRYRGAEFNTWTWAIGDGVKTNTAQSSSCAYDRILLNPAIMPDYQASGVYRHGINMRLDGRRVSDHYLVWARFGGVIKKKKRQIIAVSVRGGVKKQRRLKLRNKVYLNGLGLSRPATGKRARLYIVRYVKTNNYNSFNDYPLTDVRSSGPTEVQITAAGDFQTEVEWTAQDIGLYNAIVDMNGDGVFKAPDGDVANNNNEADIIVVPSTTTHSQLASLDDNGNTRELFDADRAENVYAIARNLPASTDMNLYVVATKLIPSFTTWAALKASGALDLASVAVPVLLRTDNLVKTSGGWTSSAAAVQAQKGPAQNQTTPIYQTVTSDVDGGLFASAWSTPSLLFNGAAYTAPPQSYDVPSSVTLPDVPPNADWDMCDDDVIAQYPQIAPACRAPTPSKKKKKRKASNSGGVTFPAYFGTKFNLVLDVNKNGVFDGPDLVDTYDIGDMTTFFANGAQTLGPANDGSPAVGEYKEFLDAHMNLNAGLDSSNTYTLATSDASYHYNCSSTLTRGFFNTHLTPNAQTGFRIQSNELYVNEVSPENAYAYSTNVNYYDVDADFGEACWSASDTATYDGFKASSNSTVTIVADTHEVNNTVIADQGSSICMVAETGLVLGATSAGATGGALIGGPVGAAIGGALGFIVGEVETHIATPSCH